MQWLWSCCVLHRHCLATALVLLCVTQSLRTNGAFTGSLIIVVMYSPLRTYLSSLVYISSARRSTAMSFISIHYPRHVPLQTVLCFVVWARQQFTFTRCYCLLIGGSLNPGRTIGWLGGAGSLGGGGALMLERAVEPGGTLGAGLEGEAPGWRDLISGFNAPCCCIMLLPRILDCVPLTTARCKIGSVGKTYELE